MRALLFDWDGVVLRSEMAKAAGWVLGALYILGKVSETLIDRLYKAHDRDARAAVNEAFQLLREQHLDALQAVVALSGLSRQETRKAVWRLLLADQGPTSEDDLEKYRLSIKDPLILYGAEVIQGTIRLIQAAKARLHLGLVTQATQADVQAQAKALKIPIRLFDAVECAGDDFYKPMADSLDKKAVAYAIICARLGTSPSEVVAFEDSDSGIESATAAGLRCVALRELQNQQQLTLAQVVVPDLG